MFDSYLAYIHSDEFATEWEDFSAALDEVMILHLEEENFIEKEFAIMNSYERFVDRYFDIFTMRTIQVLYRYSNKIRHNGIITKDFLIAFLAEPNFYNGRIVRKEVETYINKI